MARTNFPNGITSMGVPIPGGLLSQGKTFFVGPRTGLIGNPGGDTINPVAKISQGYAKMAAGRNDVLYLLAQGALAADTTDYQSVTLNWNLNNTHLIGITAPGLIAQRARIAQLSTATGISPLVNISASACLWQNIHVFQGVDDVTSLISVLVSGDRNVFYRCHFAGGGHATQAASTSMRSLKITGSENFFEECTLGLDTIPRGVANAEIEFAAGTAAATRTIFKSCLILTNASNAAHLFMLLGASSIDRFVEFEDCVFLNPIKSAATQMTTAMTVNASAGGFILLKDCTLLGATDWDAAASGNVYIDGAPPVAATSGLAVNVA